MGGRVGERAEQPKVPTMRSIGGMAAEGGAACFSLLKPKTRNPGGLAAAGVP